MSTRNWLTKTKSYIQEIPLEQVHSKYSTGLGVSVVKGRFQLYTDKVIYSFEDLYNNFKVTCNKINWQVFKPKEILVLGLGLGSVIQLIEKKNKQDMHITAVDIDEMSFYLTRKYTSSKFRSPVLYVHADAELFIAQSKQKYDLIVFDIFIDDKIPTHLQSLRFMKRLNQRLQPNGILLMNRIAMESDQIMENMQFMEYIFKKIWTEAAIIDVPPNWVLISDEKVLK